MGSDRDQEISGKKKQASEVQAHQGSQEDVQLGDRVKKSENQRGNHQSDPD